MTWEVVVVAFKLGSSFLKDRKIKERQKNTGTDFGKQGVRTQHLGPQDTCFCSTSHWNRKMVGLQTTACLLLRMGARRMVDKEKLRVKGKPGRPNCHVMKLKVTYLPVSWEKLDSRPCVRLDKERNNCLRWRERNQQDATNLMFVIKLLSQHVSGIIMPIIRRTRVCTAAYGVLHWFAGCGCVEFQLHTTISQHNQCRTPYAAVHTLVLLMMGIMIPETCWDRSLIINIRLVASCWFLCLHLMFMMHGHKSLK